LQIELKEITNKIMDKSDQFEKELLDISYDGTDDQMESMVENIIDTEKPNSLLTNDEM